MTEVHSRVHERHPELVDGDVRHAWENYEFSAIRKRAEIEVRLGFDSIGRCLEMIGARQENGWFVYHAFTPPTKKFIREISRNVRWI